MAKIGLGFDTGGTFTDAVVMDLDNDTILARSKSLTTMDDLSRGIRGAVEGFDRDLLRKVDVVCLSSTLATNSIVEGKGCRVALIIMGFNTAMSTKADYVVTVDGSHTAYGKEDVPLDVEKVRSFLESIRGKVDAVAINGFMSVRNPEHENAVREMVREILGVPAVCGYELSSSLGFNERAITCVMNARLLPVIEELLLSVNKVIREMGIEAPLMIVKGDGSVMGEATARERPVETILSGPASSLTGARKLAHVNDAIVIDIGGTTTDIGIIRDGKTHLEDEGALIGGFRTRVAAADITTAGLGGDSRIIVNGKKVSLSTVKVLPLCTAAMKYPSIRQKLEILVKEGPKNIPYANYARNLVMDTEFFIRLKKGGDSDLSDLDRKFLEFVDGEPHSMADAKWKFREPAVSFDIDKMEERRLIQRIGLTPTDIMHFRGTFTMFDVEVSKLAIRYHSANLGITDGEFADLVDSLITEKIGTEIVKKVITENRKETDFSGFGLDIMSDAVNSKEGPDYTVAFKLNKPIVGLGGPSYYMLPKVAQVLGTELILPEDFSVGNAVGAVSGKVEESISILIQSVLGSTLKAPASLVFSRLGRQYYNSFNDGVEAAREMGRKYVVEAAEKAGATNIKVEEYVDRSDVDLGEERYLSTVTEIKMVIKATGEPATRRTPSE